MRNKNRQKKQKSCKKTKRKQKKDKKRNFKLPLVTFMSDTWFKYSLCRPGDPRCEKLRDFYLKNILGYLIKNLRIGSPELTPEHVLEMRNILDVLYENEDYVINLEMENHKLDLFTRNRIEVYGANTTAHAQIKGDDYENARKVITIVFVNDSFKESKQLIEKMSTGTEKSENHFTSGQQCHWKFFVQLPMIDKIVKEKEVLNEFEALIYLTLHQNLRGIKYVEKEGIIEMVKEMKAEFVREAPALYEAAVKRERYNTIDYKAFIRSQAMENVKREYEARAKAIREESEIKAKKIVALEAQKNIDEGEKRGEMKGEKKALIEMCNVLIGLKYKKKRNSWLKRCTIDELKKIILYTQEENHDDYDELLNSIFSSDNAYVSGR